VKWLQGWLCLIISMGVISYHLLPDLLPQHTPTQPPLNLQSQIPSSPFTPHYLKLYPLPLQLWGNMPIYNPPATNEAAVIVLAPTCYDAPNYRVLCLGRVKNPLNQTVEQIRLRVYLLNHLGEIRTIQIVHLEQRYILPGESAPYRIFFENTSESQAWVRAEVEQVKSAPNPPPPLMVEAERGSINTAGPGYGRYIVEGIVRRDAAPGLQSLSAVVTLYDPGLKVVGYRMVTLPQTNNPQQPLQVEIIPQIINTRYHHTLYIEPR